MTKQSRFTTSTAITDSCTINPPLINSLLKVVAVSIETASKTKQVIKQ